MQTQKATIELPSASKSCDTVSESSEEKTFQGGFFKITSPVRPCPSPGAEPETGKITKAAIILFSFTGKRNNQ
jgi:hypothetical protein